MGTTALILVFRMPTVKLLKCALAITIQSPRFHGSRPTVPCNAPVAPFYSLLFALLACFAYSRFSCFAIALTADLRITTLDKSQPHTLSWSTPIILSQLSTWTVTNKPPSPPTDVTHPPTTTSRHTGVLQITSDGSSVTMGLSQLLSQYSLEISHH